MIMNSWKSIGLSACAPPLTMFIIGTGSSARRGAADIAIERRVVGGGRRLGDGQRHAEDRVGAEPAFVGRAVERDQGLVDLGLRLGVHAAERVEDLAVDARPPCARPCRRSAPCRRRAARPLRAPGRGARRNGGAAREPSSRMTSTSTVGLPRLSRISRPIMSVMAVMDGPGTGDAGLLQDPLSSDYHCFHWIIAPHVACMSRY